MTAIIYGWATRPDFLLPRLYPKAHYVSAKPLVDADKITREAQTHAAQRNLWFFHLNISRSEHWLPNRSGIVKNLRLSGYRVINDKIFPECIPSYYIFKHNNQKP